MRTLADWLALQEATHPRAVDLGLERIEAVARRLGIGRPPYRVATIGGTNGKGSTVALMEAVLRAGGVRTGAFTSPHLVRYNERIRIDGQPIGDAPLVAAFERIERARGDISLTFFEYNALAALLTFESAGVEAGLLEVGLGGRLDATNLVDADVAVICSIGLDHRDWLGDTLELIGAEKAGIMRPDKPVVLGTAGMPASVFAAVERTGARALVAGRDFWWQTARAVRTASAVPPATLAQPRDEDMRWTFHGVSSSAEDLPPPALPGEIQIRNAATAFTALEALGFGRLLVEPALAAALRSVALPGRFQVVPGEVEWILDVAHNEPAAQVLASNLHARARSGRTLAVTGILGDKDAAGITAALAAVIDEWIVVALPSARGGTAEDLAQRMKLPARGFTAAGSVADGCRIASAHARPGDRVVVFGSFLTVGPALEWLRLY